MPPFLTSSIYMERAESSQVDEAATAQSLTSTMVESVPLSRSERAIRALNVMVASLILVLTLPLWIIIAIAVKLTSRGPVFYTQVRVGRDWRNASPTPGDPRRGVDLGGRPFTIVKFRTMRVDAEQHHGAVWAKTDDNRVTMIGGFLRSCRLDELPQLLNVIHGDMNLVGPRPERPELFAKLREQIPEYQRRQRVPPGITGHAQVHLQYDTSVEDVRRKVEHDLEYIASRSLWADLKIMLKTVPVMLFRKGGW